MNHLMKSLVLALLMPLVSGAQYISLNEQLMTISEEMFRNGNENYIIVDAIRDGILQPEAPCNFSYLNESFTFNQFALSKKYAFTYEKKIKQFFENYNEGHDFAIFMNLSKVSMKDIMNAESTFRKNSRIMDVKPAVNIPTPKTTNTDGIIKAMLQDGLITNRKNYTVKWNMTGVYVNGKKLKGEAAEKYNTLFEAQAGYKAKMPENGITITQTP